MEAFDLESMAKVLHHVKDCGEFPSYFTSKEESNTLGPSNVSPDIITNIKQSLNIGEKFDDIRIVFIDGIILYHENSNLVDKFEVKLMMRARYQDLKKRREARNGYVTLSDFWVDPPNYFDEIVWPGYVKTHHYLFDDGNVEGKLNNQANDLGIHTPQSLDNNMEQLLNWAVSIIVRELS